MISGTVRSRRFLALVTAGALLLGACSGGDDDSSPATTTVSPDSTSSPTDAWPIVTVDGITNPGASASPPLGLRLSEGSPNVAGDPLAPVADGTPLSSAAVDSILNRLPIWLIPPDDVVEFNRPPASLAPPLVGNFIETSFPPGEAAPPDIEAPEPEVEPLQVLRFQPEGPVDIAPFLTVTFDQPMVPLSTLDQLDDADVPVVVTPSIADSGVEGRWRWIGTRTLRFEVIPGVLDRLPAATTYTVEVPAGTRAANGAELAEAVAWSFTTPSAAVTTLTGRSDSMPLDPVFVAALDQRVNANDILAVTRVLADGEATPIRLATAAEVENDDTARRAVDGSLGGRTVAFRPVTEFSPDTAVRIEIGPRIPSAEGPNTDPGRFTYDGRTFGSLRVERSECAFGGDCVPGSIFRIQFSNALEGQAFSAEQVSVSPAIPGLRINVFGNAIEIGGATAGRTTYTVTLDGSLKDVFGQTLGDDTDAEFVVGSALPSLRGFDRQWVTLDPSAETPTITASTVNHDTVHVTAWAVQPPDYAEFQRFLDNQFSDTNPPLPDWPEVFNEILEIDSVPDTFIETPIDLSPAFNLAGSQMVVRIESTTEFSRNDEAYFRNFPSIAWVQSTTIGVDAIYDDDELLIWVTDLNTGEPIERSPVELLGDGRIATTDDDGLAMLELGDRGILGLFASAGERTAFLPAARFNGWTTERQSDEGRWYVFDDRGIYRPGETVNLTGWVRRVALTEDAQLALYNDATRVAYEIFDPQGNNIGSGSLDLNPLGGFNLSFDTPENSNLGFGWVNLTLMGSTRRLFQSTTHNFQIQEFRTPEFEVTARPESPGPYFTARPATVAVDAEFFAGGPLPNADVNWLVSTQETTYRPPNRDDYNFGVWIPWWFAGGFGGGFSGGFERGLGIDSVSDCFDCGPGFSSTQFEQFTGVTNGDGTHFLQIDFDGPDVDLPTTITAEATVFDVNRQAFAGRTNLLVHAAQHYVGLKSDRTFVERGTPLRIDAVVTDIDGELVPGRAVDIVAGRLEWSYNGSIWAEEVVESQTCTITSTASANDESMRCEFSTDLGGTYRITAVVIDETNHRNRTELTQWVTGGSGRPVRNVERESITIVPDREIYQPGDVAELLVQAPFAPAHGLVTVTRNGIQSAEVFTAEDGSAVVEIPIDEAHIPNINVQIEMVGSDVRTADDGTLLPDVPRRPAFASGQIELSVPPLTRELTVVATPADRAVEPGTDTSVTVTVTDAEGRPVSGADVAMVVVDEAVLSLTGYELPSVLDVFYSPLFSFVNTELTRSSIVLTRADLLGGDEDRVTPPQAAPSPEADFAAGGAAADSAESATEESGPPIVVRDNFEALVVYAPEESTSANGTVTVAVPLPDNLTRYRVMAVAVDGADHFGQGESTITARLPLLVRPSAPRFLNFGDRFELSVVVQNQTDGPLDVEVAVQTSNLSLTGPRGKSVTVPGNDRVEVRFPAKAEEVGTARFRVAAVSGQFADAAENNLPVYTPATAEAFATYGVIDDLPIGQPVLAPTDVFPQFGGLEINTSSTALQALTDAVLYLADYRYESSDGFASRIMAIAALRDVLEAFDAAGLPSPAELNAQVNRDIARLAALQNDDGGFPYWQRGRESIPWQSIQSTHALVLANDAGYEVPSDTLNRAYRHIANVEQHIPSTYGEDLRNTLRAYSLFVLELGGRGNTPKATDLYISQRDNLDLDAIAWLWPSIVNPKLTTEIETLFLNRAVETAGAATFATSYGEDAYLIAHSDRRTDGIILDAIIGQAPDSDLIPKVVAGLLGNQTKGRWSNAHENAFILLAMNRYFNTFEDVTPDFVARAWLGDVYAAEHEFVGRTTDRRATLVPMADLLALPSPDVVLSKEGDGRLYYRLGLRYAPEDLVLDPRDEGFVVERSYEAVDDPGDVRLDSGGVWHIKAGARVQVRLTMVADARRTHVALIDPLPAGLEPINPSLAVSQTTIPGANTDDSLPPQSFFIWWNWFEHQNLRDDRAEAFTSFLSAGTYDYTYVTRATTIGEFVVPPTRAEEIYAPEVFGRSSTSQVVIED